MLKQNPGVLRRTAISLLKSRKQKEACIHERLQQVTGMTTLEKIYLGCKTGKERLDAWTLALNRRSKFQSSEG